MTKRRGDPAQISLFQLIEPSPRPSPSPLTPQRSGAPIIVTSSWFTRLPAGYVRIGISRGLPRFATQEDRARRYSSLNPGPWFNSVSEAEYVERYYSEVLDLLDPKQVVAELQAIAGDGIPTIVCFESPKDDSSWCHRGIVSFWLHDRLRIEVSEYSLEHRGFGADHPKLCAAAKRG